MKYKCERKNNLKSAILIAQSIRPSENKKPHNDQNKTVELYFKRHEKVSKSKRQNFARASFSIKNEKSPRSTTFNEASSRLGNEIPATLMKRTSFFREL